MRLRHLLGGVEFHWNHHQLVRSSGSEIPKQTRWPHAYEKNCYFSLASLRLIYSFLLPATPRYEIQYRFGVIFYHSKASRLRENTK